MPGTMLKKMLLSLCKSGAEFCHAENIKSGVERGPEDSSLGSSRDSEFSKLIAGGGRFHPDGENNIPYYPPERHPGHVEIIMPLDGCTDFLINDRWHQLNSEKVFILMPNTLHTERHINRAPYTLFWLTCLPSMITLHKTAFSPETLYAQSACRVAITPPMSRSLWESGTQNPADEPHFFSLLVQCLDFAVSHELAEQNTKDYHFSVLSQILEYLQENYSRPVTLSELSQMARCSPVYLSSLFRQRYGTTIHRYLSELRLKKAMELLDRGMFPGEAARSAGFSDQRYFCRFFHKHTNKTPSEYKNTKKK